MKRISGTHVVGLIAVLAMALALVLGYAPGLLPETLREMIQVASRAVDIELAMLFVGFVIGIVGLLSSWVWRTGERSGDWDDGDAESPRRDVSVSGADLTRTVEACQDNGTPLTASANEPLKESLRAILAEAHPHEWTREGNEERTLEPIEQGTWTDDRLAAPFLSTADTVAYPLSHRLYAWLYPASAYERRARRALRAVEDVCAEQYSGYEPPERPPLRLDRLQALGQAVRGGDGE